MTAIETTNGHRTRAALPAFTFPDSGITVGLRRFSPDLQDAIARAYQRDHPLPPLPMVDGVEREDGTFEQEPNAADPDYEEALRAYWQGVTLYVSTKFVELAMQQMEVAVDTEAVTTLRAQMELIGTPIDPDLDDRTVYLRFIAISSTYDLTSLIAYVQRRSMPTEVAVQEFLESFQRPA